MKEDLIQGDARVQTDGRFFVFPIVLIIVLIGFAMRLWYLQVVQSDELREKAKNLRSSTVERLAPRGMIVDRHGVLLAGVANQIVITGVPRILKKNPDVLERTAGILNVPIEKLQKNIEKIWRTDVPGPIFTGATVAQATKISEDATLLGINVSSQPMRIYPDPLHYSHAIGYVSQPNQKDVDRLKAKKVQAAEYIGKIGIERSAEQYLMGKPGEEEFQVDATNRPVRTIRSTPAIPGDKIVLGLDAEVQQYAFEALAGRPGSVVMLDPRNGQVIALVSNPSYDTSMFLGGISSKDYTALNSDPQLPLFNRSIYSASAPGSTFKIVTSIASMMAGQFNPNNTVVCNGYYQVGNRKIKCLGHHGAISFKQAFSRSCNAYFMGIGMRAGIENIRKASLACGLGAQTGIDLVGEGAGLVPTREWVEGINKGKYIWYPGQTANFAIGQGELATTPLQMAVVAMLAANGGTVYRPNMLRERIKPNGVHVIIQPAINNKIIAPPGFWEILDEAMGMVTTVGTARGTQIPGLRWAGKTGSAERNGQSRTDSWFVGFAPLNNPRVAIAVRVESGGHGGEVACPVAAKLCAMYLRVGVYANKPRMLAKFNSNTVTGGVMTDPKKLPAGTPSVSPNIKSNTLQKPPANSSVKTTAQR